VEALDLLGRLEARKASPTVLSILRTHANPEVIRQAAKTAGALEIAESVPRLIELLHHEDWRVRERAAFGIGAIAQDDGVEPLVSVALRS
jgi:HEAT repeat protein